jgi:ribosomal protein S27AE
MTDPWTLAAVGAKVLDALLRAWGWLNRRKREQTGRPEPVAEPLWAGWVDLDEVAYSGATWRPQIPEWGTLMAHGDRAEPSLLQQVQESLHVAGPLCPRCSTELGSASLGFPFFGQRWRCDACGYSTWLRRPLAKTLATVDRLVRGRQARQAQHGA